MFSKEILRERTGLLTGILRILGTYVLITSVENVLIHQGCTGSNLSEEANLDRLSNLDSLTLLNKDLTSVFTSIFPIERWNTVLFWMMSFFERLKGGHEVVATRYTRCDDSLGDTCCHCAFDNGGNGVHGSNDLRLELRWDVELDLLEQVLGGTETTDYKNIL